MYRCVLEARNAIIAAMKPGVTIESLREVAAPVYAKHGYAKEFEASGRYIGHFVGIAVHDVIDIVGEAARTPFVAGTVFNVEPILEIPDRKIHIRLEDTIVVTDTGADKLTAAVPAEVEPLYALIRQKGVNSVPLADRTSRLVRLRRGSSSRSRTAWPRLREPGIAGLRSFRSLDAGPVKRVASRPHPAVSRARFGPCAKLACVPNSPHSIPA
jgi:peptidase M24-like protein